MNSPPPVSELGRKHVRNGAVHSRVTPRGDAAAPRLKLPEALAKAPSAGALALKIHLARFCNAGCVLGSAVMSLRLSYVRPDSEHAYQGYWELHRNSRRMPGC
jgi:hypothetical protein